MEVLNLFLSYLKEDVKVSNVSSGSWEKRSDGKGELGQPFLSLISVRWVAALKVSCNGMALQRKVFRFLVDRASIPPIDNLQTWRFVYPRFRYETRKWIFGGVDRQTVMGRVNGSIFSWKDGAAMVDLVGMMSSPTYVCRVIFGTERKDSDVPKPQPLCKRLRGSNYRLRRFSYTLHVQSDFGFDAIQQERIFVHSLGQNSKIKHYHSFWLL